MSNTTAQFYLENRKSPPSCLGSAVLFRKKKVTAVVFRFSCRCKRGLVNKIWYIKRSLQVEMCFHLVEKASRSKYPIGSGPGFAICVFPAIDFEVFNPTRVLCFRACVANKSPKSVLVLCRRLASSVFNRSRFLLLSVCVAGLSRRFRSRFLFRVAVWRPVFCVAVWRMF